MGGRFPYPERGVERYIAGMSSKAIAILAVCVVTIGWSLVRIVGAAVDDHIVPAGTEPVFWCAAEDIQVPFSFELMEAAGEVGEVRVRSLVPYFKCPDCGAFSVYHDMERSSGTIPVTPREPGQE